MPEGLIELITEVITSWQVIAVVIAFFLYWSLVSMAITPREPRPEKSPQLKKLKRPREKDSELPSDIDTGDLGLGE
ncbi:MAG: hypothetical protein LBD22_05105 [Spirochaetaceae bacterium]|jgi:uncharacterized membrane protein|nr:hypothetical protein [Spirochaetaceae bacterium]